MVVAGALRMRSVSFIVARLDLLGRALWPDDTTDAERADDDRRMRLENHDPVRPSILLLREVLLSSWSSCTSFIAKSELLFAPAD